MIGSKNAYVLIMLPNSFHALHFCSCKIYFNNNNNNNNEDTKAKLKMSGFHNIKESAGGLQVFKLLLLLLLSYDMDISCHRHFFPVLLLNQL